ncbi:1,2-phenylacetyl-CoA epoxidase subunit PaaE [Ideonella livida]|uniref:Phenylacetate-CoA oxygenase/reductase subunit PaaK n=1 Tax=Ideonella livida TaxID=2707176 RepID=A0A7C9TM11_9BURK|nr:1,2-phenylacetyl-CoA epoxidase subunit PaaE [Ideonella livida]NDY92884.1 phenylacetate-CoA oxygenase/reductase subunit PaaK [Ideonella livida]
MSPTTLFHPLRVAAVEDDTPDAKVIRFEVPEALRPLFLGFEPGQYLTLRAQVDGQELRRAYSICAGVDDAALRVGVRRVNGGAFSSWLHRSVQAGHTLEVMPPQGRFHLTLNPQARRHVLAIAGGSGITPILSLVKSVLAREPGSRVTLLYANRSLASTMFKEELEDLKNRYLTRLVLHHVFSREETEVPLLHGRLDQAKVGDFLRLLVPAATVDEAFICGPAEMNDAAEAALLAAHLPAERIHIERFGVAGSPAGGAVEHESRPEDADHARITLVRDGLKREFIFRKDQPSLLDAAAAAGLEVPFSCTSGVCGTCRAKVLEGRARMDRNFALSPQEVADGYVLCCQAHALTERVLLSFDDK